MNKTTTTVLMAAGLMVLAGCKTEVMRDRHFQGDPPQDDPVVQQNMPEQKESLTPDKTVAPTPTPDSSRTFRPMEGTYGNEGVEKAPARRRAARRAKGAAKGAKGAVAAPGGVYIVKPGDTLGRIAYRHRVTVKALRQANNRTPEQDRFLRPGTKLVIPGGKGAAVSAGKKGKAASPALRRGKNTPKLNADGTYTMVRGDNIPKVARKFGIRAKALQRANNLTDEETTKLQIGHKLVIPSGDDAKAAPRKTARKAARKAAPVKKAEVPAQQNPLPPPPAAADDSSAGTALPPPPPAPAAPAAPAAAETTAVLPPPAPVAADDNAGTNFVSVAGFNSLEEFASKHNTTVDELLRLNPRIDRNAPISSFGMLYVPRSAAK